MVPVQSFQNTSSLTGHSPVDAQANSPDCPIWFSALDKFFAQSINGGDDFVGVSGDRAGAFFTHAARAIHDNCMDSSR